MKTNRADTGSSLSAAMDTAQRWHSSTHNVAISHGAGLQDYKLVAGWEKKRRAEVPVCPVFGLLRYHVRY